MILVKNDKPLIVVGVEDSSTTKSVMLFVTKLGFPGVTIVHPNDFKDLENKHDYQYLITVTLFPEERKEMIQIVDDLNLDCISYIDDSCLVHESAKLGKDLTSYGYNLIMANTVIGNHVMMDAYCLVAHDTIIGDNCLIGSGTLIAGKVKIGKNCTFGMKSAVINDVSICDNVHIGAFSNVTKDIEVPGFYIGSPARLVRSNPDH